MKAVIFGAYDSIHMLSSPRQREYCLLLNAYTGELEKKVGSYPQIVTIILDKTQISMGLRHDFFGTPDIV